jgi:hypothetical protein
VAACKKNCSPQDVERARTFVDNDELPESHATALLPAFFWNLDPAGIPTTEELDVVDSESRMKDVVSRALISNDAIAFMHELPPGAGVPLWHRVWPWTQFMSDSWDHFRDFPYDRSTFYYHFLRLAGQLQDDPQTWELMSGTSGFRTFIVHIWKLVPTVPDPLQEFMLTHLGSFILDSGVSDPGHLAEFIEGAGGTVDDLANLAVAYMRMVAVRASPLSRSSTCIDMSSLVAFIIEVEFSGELQEQWPVAPLTPLCKALILNKGIGALVSVMVLIIRIPGADTGETLSGCFDLLKHMLFSMEGYTRLEEGLRCTTGTLPRQGHARHLDGRGRRFGTF